MLHAEGRAQGPFVLLHGGAGPQDRDPKSLTAMTQELVAIARAAIANIGSGQDLLDLVVAALCQLEDSPHFNAGYGGAIQADGGVRLTAALMDGRRQSFSGVVGLQFARHASLVASVLQRRTARVLASPGAELVARELNLPVESLVTEERLSRFAQRAREDAFTLYDTVGAIVFDGRGQLVAGTSTGGRGSEYPGRVSDSATVAGTYASEFCGVSATGVGEEIVDDALAARIDTRVRDGMSLADASKKALAEAMRLSRQYGWIAASACGDWVVAHTTPSMSYAVIDFDGKVLKSSGTTW